MGNQQQNPQHFNPKEWTMIDTNPNQVTLWQNNHNPHIHIEEHKIYTIDQEEFGHQRQLYFERKNHPYLVATYYFQQEKTVEICVSRFIAHVFIEKIPIKILDLKDLPIPDLIHTHNQCFQGYKALAQTLGCFRVQNSFIGVNQKGVVKVWAGSQLSQVGLIGNKIKQEQMVRSIIQSLQTCSQAKDKARHAVSLKTYLYRITDRLTFDQAIQELRSFAAQYNQGFIPSRLESLYNGQHFEMFLDPLIRSNHLQHSRYIAQISSSRMRDNNKKSREETTFGRVESGQIDYASSRKAPAVNQPKYQPFFKCMDDEQKLKTTKLVNKEEILKNYSSYKGDIQNTQNVQCKHYNPNQTKSVSLNSFNPRPVTTQNSVSLMPNQAQPTRQQKTYQNPFIDSAVPHNINQQRIVKTQTLNHKNSQQNLSNMQIQQNNNQSTGINFHLETRTNSQFVFTNTSQKMYEPASHIPVILNNQSNSTNHSQALQPVSNNLHYSNKHNQNEAEKRKKSIPQSIIMQLYTSQDKFAYTNEQYLTLKTFGLVKQSVSEVQEAQNQLRFDSATPIKDGQYNNLTGLPHNYHKINTNLDSIQELNSEHYKYDIISQKSSPSRQPSQLFQGRGYSNQSFMINASNGKIPQHLLQNKRQISNNNSASNYSKQLY